MCVPTDSAAWIHLPILLDFPPKPLTLAVIYPHRQFLSERVRAFADFMAEQGA